MVAGTRGRGRGEDWESPAPSAGITMCLGLARIVAQCRPPCQQWQTVVPSVLGPGCAAGQHPAALLLVVAGGIMAGRLSWRGLGVQSFEDMW